MLSYRHHPVLSNATRRGSCALREEANRPPRILLRLPPISYCPCLGRPWPSRRSIIACHLVTKSPFGQSHHSSVVHCSKNALSRHSDSFRVNPSALIPYEQLLKCPNPEILLKRLSLAHSTPSEWSSSVNGLERRRIYTPRVSEG